MKDATAGGGGAPCSLIGICLDWSHIVCKACVCASVRLSVCLVSQRKFKVSLTARAHSQCGPGDGGGGGSGGERERELEHSNENAPG